MSSIEQYAFGPFKIDPRQVFYSTPLSYALVNLRPLLPGNVLVCPRRDAVRFGDLTADETRDLWLTAQTVGTQLESYHKASSLAFAIQDGPQAGQTVPHVHIHIVPRKAASSEENDGNKDVKEKQKLDLDIQMKNRTMEEMAQEADEYRSLLSKI
ncbi:bifunctional bis(5'-adenosyl)-triphosphatase/adenylylsulfatase FHIT-like [Citrus sinensis]|uniref:bifunctional bis(5'-adenosyl)-triphosphatase/adenylylsulfatase FHIT-like n=1 Tax=Citrus sinensis TaxID=2711 RepID=UPI0022791431|nr:bifunctional bis(5'-adenosyl)-triphosphatase/adenylylsulfatase FHIT-like [Citrus sinensis]